LTLVLRILDVLLLLELVLVVMGCEGKSETGEGEGGDLVGGNTLLFFCSPWPPRSFLPSFIFYLFSFSFLTPSHTATDPLLV
jgi:hypothetical protein